MPCEYGGYSHIHRHLCSNYESTKRVGRGRKTYRDGELLAKCCTSPAPFHITLPTPRPENNECSQVPPNQLQGFYIHTCFLTTTLISDSSYPCFMD